MTSVDQCLNIILEGNLMETSTHNYVVVIIGHLQKVGLAPRSDTTICDRVFLEIAFQDRAHTDFMSDLSRAIIS
jgi:hypothetical protein